MEKRNEQLSKRDSIMRRLGAVVGVILISFISINIIFVILGVSAKDGLPNVFGYVPVIETTEEMESEDSPIKKNAMVFFRRTTADEVEKGEIITYTLGGRLFISRVQSISEIGGVRAFVVSGDNTDVETTITEDYLVGTYKGRIALLGGLLIFSQTMLGMGILVIVPIAVYVAVDYITKKQEEARLKKEYESLLVPVSVITPASVITPVSVIEAVTPDTKNKK